MRCQNSISVSGVENEKMPLISVIVNCYNGSRFLREALDSIVAQSYSNWEVIFWDNQSTDSSAQIFKEYTDPRMKYFYSPEFTTLGMARNLAVNSSSGEWVAFLDCDDLWTPDKLQLQMDIICAEDKNLGLVYGNSLVIIQRNENISQWARKLSKYSNKDALNKLPEGDIFSELVKINFVPLLTAMVRKNLYLHVGGVSPNYVQAEDYDLFVKIASNNLVRAVQDVIGYYRVHDNNASHNNLEIGYLECREIVSKFLPDPRAKIGLQYQYTYHSIYLISNRFFIKGFFYLVRFGSFRAIIKLALQRLLKILKRIF